MLRTMMKSKIELVHIVDVTDAARLETHTIAGDPRLTRGDAVSAVGH